MYWTWRNVLWRLQCELAASRKCAKLILFMFIREIHYCNIFWTLNNWNIFSRDRTTSTAFTNVHERWTLRFWSYFEYLRYLDTFLDQSRFEQPYGHVPRGIRYNVKKKKRLLLTKQNICRFWGEKSWVALFSLLKYLICTNWWVVFAWLSDQSSMIALAWFECRIKIKIWIGILFTIQL